MTRFCSHDHKNLPNTLQKVLGLQLALALKKENQSYLSGNFQSEAEIKGEVVSGDTTQLLRTKKINNKAGIFLNQHVKLFLPSSRGEQKFKVKRSLVI